MAISKEYDRDRVLIDIKRKIKEGLTQQGIIDWVRDNYTISNQNVVFLMKEARSNYQRELDFNLRDIMLKHSARYEQIWSKNYKNPFSKKLDNPEEDLDDESVRKTLFKVAKHYMTAAKALQNKEKMLGIVHSRMDVELKNEFFEQQEREKEKHLDVSRYDLNKLSMEEKIEFLHLLKKSKGELEETKPKVTTTITVKTDNKEETIKFEPVAEKFDVEDIEHEEIKTESPQIAVDNINKKIIESEAKKVNEVFEKDIEADKKRRIKEAKEKIIKKYKGKK